MRLKTSTLTGPALNWAVAKCEEANVYVTQNGLDWMDVDRDHNGNWIKYDPSTDWSQGGPIIERENIEIGRTPVEWRAQRYDFIRVAYGPTPLVAAMRCYVASELGDEVDVPDEIGGAA